MSHETLKRQDSITSRGIMAACFATLLTLSLNVVAEDAAAPYEVECTDGTCVVDKATYIGWRTYHNACHVCHAQDATGSTFAPSLLDRLQTIDKERFYDSLANGYTGQVGIMPPWKDDPNVNKRFDELYAYLKARSDGALAPGRPTRKR
jgi:mono/diheme cytochrome c family protein